MIYCKNETKYLPKLSVLPIGTQIQSVWLIDFSPMVYVRFELIGNNQWQTIEFTESLNIRKWKVYPLKLFFTSQELTKILNSTTSKYPMFQIYIPRKNENDFNGIIKYFDNWEESEYLLNNSDLKIYSLETILNKVMIRSVSGGLEYLIYVNAEHKNVLRYPLGRDKYVVFHLSKEELHNIVKSYGYDINLIRFRELISF